MTNVKAQMSKEGLKSKAQIGTSHVPLTFGFCHLTFRSGGAA